MKALIHRWVRHRLPRLGGMLGGTVGIGRAATDHDQSQGARKGQLGGLR